MKTKLKAGWKRLLKLADILDVADAEHKKKGEPTYDQSQITHRCGSPACAIGHWISHNRRRGWRVKEGLVYLRGEYVYWDYPQLLAEFDIDYGDGRQLFDSGGCGGAHTGKQAALYIRKFVARKLKSAV